MVLGANDVTLGEMVLAYQTSLNGHRYVSNDSTDRFHFIKEIRNRKGELIFENKLIYQTTGCATCQLRYYFFQIWYPSISRATSWKNCPMTFLANLIKMASHSTTLQIFEKQIRCLGQIYQI